MNGTAHVNYLYQFNATDLIAGTQAGTDERRTAIEELELAIRNLDVYNQISNFEFESDYSDSIAIEFNLLEIDSLGKFLSLNNDYGISFSYSPKKFLVTFSQFFQTHLMVIFAQIKSGNLQLAFSFDRPIKKLKSKNKFTKQVGQKIIIHSTLTDCGIKGKENQIIVLFD